MEELLKSGLINLTELAVKLYPNKTRKQASSTLRAKIHKQSFNKLNGYEMQAIRSEVAYFAMLLNNCELEKGFNKVYDVIPV